MQCLSRESGVVGSQGGAHLIDWASVSWGNVALLSGVAFLAALVANILSFRRRLRGALLTAVLFAALYLLGTYYLNWLTPEPSDAEMLRSACGQDAQKLCAVVRPGQQRVFYCLVNRQADVSDACRAFLETARAKSRPAEPAPVAGREKK